MDLHCEQVRTRSLPITIEATRIGQKWKVLDMSANVRREQKPPRSPYCAGVASHDETKVKAYAPKPFEFEDTFSM